ncbi:hypothetical protein NDU88_005684 [Pleurodeles waltl]|uniref:Uncharacterized protein n=1 Tax=Pleurodeles waltl TaxID=8319 RepID=A0AAV7W8I7_PLEWA|nr:hypothetical protein NDU88_005684 [Pleurodeles waltl]
MFGGLRSSSLVKSPGPAGLAPTGGPPRQDPASTARAECRTPLPRPAGPNRTCRSSARSDAPSPPIKEARSRCLPSSVWRHLVASPHNHQGDRHSSPGSSFFLGPSHDAPQLSSQGVHAKRVLKFALSLC